MERRKKSVCCNCGQIFYDSDLIPVFYMEGEGVMRGELFDHYVCPECGEDVWCSVEEVCRDCYYYDEPNRECLFGEPDEPHDKKRDCLED